MRIDSCRKCGTELEHVDSEACQVCGKEYTQFKCQRCDALTEPQYHIHKETIVIA